MWVSRKELNELKKQVEELNRKHESHVVDVANCRNFTVYEPKALADRQRYYTPFYPSSPLPQQSIAVKDVVDRILKHLCMELVYVEGQPAHVDVTKKSKKEV